jgi:hypothetical protein
VHVEVERLRTLRIRRRRYREANGRDERGEPEPFRIGAFMCVSV